MKTRPNWPAGLFAVAWLVIVLGPLVYLVTVSLRTRSEYLGKSAWSIPEKLTLENYGTVLTGGFGQYLLNNVIVTVATVAIVVVVAVPCAYAVVRSTGKFVQRGFTLLLIGLAIPAQATIIPIYLLITRMRLYDTLTAIILPTAAFALPVAMLVLTNSLRDVPRELYEAQAIDGAGPLRVLVSLVLPLARPAITTVGVYTALNAWNGFLFPLVLTQSESSRVLTLGLYDFRGQFTTNVPALLAAVTLSVLPIFVVYLIGRRFLLSGLTAGFGK
ncbi:carbohydrate ABC transporter permease [Saccharothrix syringae]|uniref:carbohydrate ABC transporter permease n=1 Tax=Saccharothrix syringae TaxID=103733 RepID=UPI000526A586|nr:carbohydrate ABC transporter permease [Saccharothrix syringae]